MLTRARSRWRDGALFLLVALLPALALGALAFRALVNEEAAVRREMRLELERAASEVSESYRRDLANASLERIAFAEMVDVDDSPEPPRARGEPEPPDACSELFAALARGAGDRQRILEECSEATTSAGRFGWPLVALDGRAPHPAEDRLVAWMKAHAARMSPAEREATRLEIDTAGWLSGEARARIQRALDASPTETPAVSHLAARRLAMAAGVPRIEWQDATSLGRVEQSGDGRYRGFVVHPGSLSRALRAGWPPLPEGMEARLVVGRKPESEARVELLEGGAWLTLDWTDPQAVARTAERSRAIVIGVAVFAGALALVLAALLYSRVRAERRLSALRTDFVAAVSHELRTPIASLRMLSELLADDKIEAGERDDVHRALAREARRLGDTVERLLGFSRMEASKHQTRRSVQPIAPLVRGAIDTFSERHPDLPAVERRLDEDARAPVDADALVMAIDNLLENARKYAPDGAPYEVDLEATNRMLRIAVRDRGPGIPRRDQQRIFQPFERVDDRLSHATEGSGIGLSLVRHVARSHGGDARVESTPGQGATFIVTIAREEP